MKHHLMKKEGTKDHFPSAQTQYLLGFERVIDQKKEMGSSDRSRRPIIVPIDTNEWLTKTGSHFNSNKLQSKEG